MNNLTRNFRIAIVSLISVILMSAVAAPQSTSVPLHTISDDEFYSLLVWIENPEDISDATSRIEENWTVGIIPILLETITFAVSDQFKSKIFELLRTNTDQSFGDDINQWYQWYWNEPANHWNGYADYKATLYRNMDPRFEGYFKDRQHQARVRLDEVIWGGVGQDGIPPLRNPQMIAAQDADYLEDDHIIFGIEINGDARAYPKRILAWHEMFIDTVGGEAIAGVYCTLCGTVIPYKTNHEGTKYQLGTSGFLYRSNKLMYDNATQSLWNTMMGEPVLGPLADQGIRLEYVGVVTTTWGQWKKRNPNTKVLSLETGFRRDYSEGAAYADYFASDRLMFQTPFQDGRLENKQEVLALRFAASPGEQLAIDTEFLIENPVYVDQVGMQKLVVLTDSSGANRVYDPGDIKFTHFDGEATVTDQQGKKWQLTENALISEDNQKLERLPYHRAFWFGWHAAFPDTRLVK